MKLIDGVVKMCELLGMRYNKQSENTYILHSHNGTFTIWEANGEFYWKEGVISQAPDKIINPVPVG